MSGHFFVSIKIKALCENSMFSFDGLLDVQTKYSNRSRGYKTNNRKEYVQKKERKTNER